VPGLSGVVAVFAGGADDAALLENGSVVAWGENKSGQLGDGTQVEKDSPTLVHGLSEVKTLALGAEATLGGHMLALLKNGTVAAVGLNTQGQVGDGSTVNRLAPVVVNGLNGVTALSASFTHNLAMLSDGSVRAWGSNQFGELGSNASPICGSKLKPLACATVPTPVPLREVTTISAGYAFSLAISNKLAYSWGHNNYGQLGDGTVTDRVAPGLVSGLTGVATISAGKTHAFALLTSSPPPPGIMFNPGPRSLTVNWEAAGLNDSWYVAYRPVAAPAVPFVRGEAGPCHAQLHRAQLGSPPLRSSGRADQRQLWPTGGSRHTSAMTDAGRSLRHRPVSRSLSRFVARWPFRTRRPAEHRIARGSPRPTSVL